MAGCLHRSVSVIKISFMRKKVVMIWMLSEHLPKSVRHGVTPSTFVSQAPSSWKV